MGQGVEQGFLGVAKSATGRRWVGPGPEVERLGLAIAQALELPEIVGRVLAARGVTPETAADYLNPTLRALMPDPSVLAGMDTAAERLAAAVTRGERIAGHCQRKNNYLPARQIDISPPLISHGFFGSIQADPHHLKYLELSSDNAAHYTTLVHLCLILRQGSIAAVGSVRNSLRI